MLEREGETYVSNFRLVCTQNAQLHTLYWLLHSYFDLDKSAAIWRRRDVFQLLNTRPPSPLS